MAIPNKLLISTLSIIKSEIGPLIQKNPEIFDDEESEDNVNF